MLQPDGDKYPSLNLGDVMTSRYLLRRDYSEIFPFLEAIRVQADGEREALGFLPHPAYEEAARQRKLILLIWEEDGQASYAGHLLFGGIFPTLKVRQISIAKQHRRGGQASRLLRALISQGEKEAYLSIVANVATDLSIANLFYEKHGFVSSRLKAGGSTRNRRINVRILQLETPSLLSLMIGSEAANWNAGLEPKKRSPDIPIYAIDLNVLFDAVRQRERSDSAGALFEAAFRHQIRIAASQEFVVELQKTSNSSASDPILSLAKRIPILPLQNKATIKAITPDIAQIVFPERWSRNELKENDHSDVQHLAHAIAAGVAGYITSDEKVLRARDGLMKSFDLDVIGLTEFVELLETPEIGHHVPNGMNAKNFRIHTPSDAEIETFLVSESISTETFFEGSEGSPARVQALPTKISISDDDGIVGVSLLFLIPGIDDASRLIVVVRQEHPFSSTIADYLISEMVRICCRHGTCRLAMLDIPSHPITRRVALSQGFEQRPVHSNVLTKVAIGRPVTEKSWDKARLSVERLTGLKLQKKCPNFQNTSVSVSTKEGNDRKLEIFDLESFLSPVIFSLRNRQAVIVPITRTFAADLLGTDLQYSFLDVPEAKFLSRRTYFNTTRAAGCMVRGSIIAFYESVRGGGRGAIVAIARIIDVTSVPVSSTPEALQRGAVVEKLEKLTKSKRILASTFDNLIAMSEPVTLKTLRKIGCVARSNFVSATPISAAQISAIVNAGWNDE